MTSIVMKSQKFLGKQHVLWDVTVCLWFWKEGGKKKRRRKFQLSSRTLVFTPLRALWKYLNESFYKAVNDYGIGWRFRSPLLNIKKEERKEKRVTKVKKRKTFKGRASIAIFRRFNSSLGHYLRKVVTWFS